MKKILILANHDVWVYRLRKEVIQALTAEQYAVYIAVPGGERISDLEALGCEVLITDYQRRGMNPLADIGLVFKYWKHISRIMPDVVLSYTIKPNLYGGLICRCKKIPQIANITGTGQVFLSKGLFKKIAIMLYRTAFKNMNTIFFQNREDRDIFRQNKIYGRYEAVIPGSGVNIEEHTYAEYPDSGQGSEIPVYRACD